MTVLFNPRSTTPGKQPLPLSLLSLAAVLESRRGPGSWALVDGNVEGHPIQTLVERLEQEPSRPLLAVTVMPGPQLTQAIAVCKAIRARLPQVPIVWGGYFPTQHADTVLGSSYVDFVVRSQGEQPLLDLREALDGRRSLDAVPGLSWKGGDGRARHNPAGAPLALDDLPDLPYARVRMGDYTHATYLGRRTLAHNSSFGCPFACSFCAVVAMSSRRWIAQSPARVERAVGQLATVYGADAVQMHDMDFFISEERTAEIADRIAGFGIRWWALGRVDRLMQYSDATWQKMVRSGLKMVFSGAESGSDETLAAMNKGGRSSAALALELARRMRRFGVVPEFSFVLGAPPDPAGDVARTFEFVRAVKAVNPATEIILYTYTPVPMASGLSDEAARRGFRFPETLDEWAADGWRDAMLRRGEKLPWLAGGIRGRIRDFERVLNAFYPTVTDPRLTGGKRALLRAVSAWRYHSKIYAAPIELRALQRVMRYQRPETTGF